MPDKTANPLFPTSRQAGSLAAILVLYLGLLIPHISRLGVTWDEQTDMGIAQSYENDRLVGSSEDPTQTRLPMYAGALLFRLTGGAGLGKARALSIGMGVLAILGCYCFARHLYGPATGLTAAFLLAMNPYFLSYSRIAFTESDIFVTACLAWLLWAMAHAMEARRAGWCFVAGLLLGLAVSAKFTAVLVAVPAALCVLAPRPRGAEPAEPLPRRAVVVLAAGVTTFGLIMLCTWGLGAFLTVADAPPRRWDQWVHVALDAYGALPAGPRIGHWAALTALLTGGGVWAAVYRQRRSGPATGLILLAATAALTFLVVPPPHTANPDLALGLMDRFLNARHLSTSLRLQSLTFYGACLLLKGGVVLGLWLWLSPFIELADWSARRRWGFPLLLTVVYVYGLSKVDWCQSFYMVALLPVLTPFVARQLVALYRRHRLVGGVAAAVLVGSLAVDHSLCYPDYNLNGHQVLGDRYIAGINPIGYTGIATLPMDGVEQVFRWMKLNVEDGATVAVYIPFAIPTHILAAACPEPGFTITDGAAPGAPPAYLTADYVVSTRELEVTAKLGVDTPPLFFVSRGFSFYDAAYVHEHFRPAYAVDRAFGIRIATVWRRNRQPGTPSRPPHGCVKKSVLPSVAQASLPVSRGPWPVHGSRHRL